MKHIFLLSLLSAICLSACSSNSVPNEIYSDVLEEDDTVDINEVVTTLVKGLNSRYTLNESDVMEADNLFTESDKFVSDFNAWKTSVEENNNKVSQSNLYINSFIQDTEVHFEEVKDFGLKHGLLYTNGKKTGLKASMEEITPLVEGQEVVESISYVEESLEYNEENDISISEETSEYVMSDEEYKAYLDELFAKEPNYKLYTVEQLHEDLSLCEDKESLVDYFNENYVDLALADWGEYVPSEYELRYDNIFYTGYDSEANGIIDEDIWNDFTLEEAREHIEKVLLYDYEYYNAYLLEDYELMNSDEYKQRYIDSRRTSKEEYERIKKQYGIVDETETSNINSNNYISDEYEVWRKSNEDYLNYIDTHDFENPVFSEVIQKDENGYYIPWELIYALADSEGRLSDYVEFIAYGEVIKVEMPEAPKSYYSDKTMSLVNWEISVDNVGTKRLEVTVRMPDREDNQTLFIDMTDDNKLIYNSTIANIIFK